MTALTSCDLLEVGLGPCARGFFTTRGAGASPVAEGDPYAGLDLALHVGDDAGRVARNRERLARALGLVPVDLAWMDQVHSAVVAPARRGEVPTADGLLVDLRRRPDGPRAAAVMVADCVPVLLASTDGTVVAAVHAGRRGMLDGVVPAALEAMAGAGIAPEEVWAAIGPSICGACYEVPESMRVESAAIEPACAATTRWGTPGLDVAAGVLAQLERAGVGHLSVGEWCTFEDPRFYSYRRDGVTGRIAGVVVARSA